MYNHDEDLMQRQRHTCYSFTRINTSWVICCAHKQFLLIIYNSLIDSLISLGEIWRLWRPVHLLSRQFILLLSGFPSLSVYKNLLRWCHIRWVVIIVHVGIFYSLQFIYFFWNMRVKFQSHWSRIVYEKDLFHALWSFHSHSNLFTIRAKTLWVMFFFYATEVLFLV